MNNSDAFLKVVKGEREVLIQAPVDEVYEYLCDFTRHAEWNYQPTKITKVSEGPVDVGTLFRARERSPGTGPWILRKAHDIMLKLLPWEGYTEAEITALEPNRRLGWKAAFPLTTGGYWMKAEWGIELEPQNGATRIRQRYAYRPQLGFQKKILKIIGIERASKPADKNIDANLTRLKEILEGRSDHETA
jgi:uncharacterized membrane protein